MFRVQKLLYNDFNAIYEPVLVENPFTLVNAQGVGLRQYHIALTGSNLVFGCDNFYKHSDYLGDEPCWLGRDLDPEIECFELVSVMPLEYMRFNFYRKSNRYLMMISFHHYKEHPMIFEFGGHIYKQYFWRTWRDRVATIRLMQPNLNYITGSSPFSSTDVQLDEETITVQVHQPPRTKSLNGACSTGNGS